MHRCVSYSERKLFKILKAFRFILFNICILSGNTLKGLLFSDNVHVCMSYESENTHLNTYFAFLVKKIYEYRFPFLYLKNITKNRGINQSNNKESFRSPCSNDDSNYCKLGVVHFTFLRNVLPSVFRYIFVYT